MKVANPQGKGNHLLVNHWYPDIQIKEKSSSETLKGYFQSLLVLSAKISLKPVVEQSYYLYLWNEELRLSPIEPEKLKQPNVDYVCACQLQTDLTWKLEFDPEHQLANSVKSYIEDFYEGFVRHLDVDTPFEELLPTYQSELSYYPRLFASALSKSLSLSMLGKDYRRLPASEMMAEVNIALTLK